MLEILLTAAGFLIIIFLCTEECQALVRRLGQCVPERPRTRILVSLLALALILAAAGLTLYSLWLLIGGPRFAYD